MIKQVLRFLNPRYQSLFLEYKVNFRPRYGHGNPAHAELYDIINCYRNDYKEFINKALSFKETIWKIRDSKVETESQKPTFNKITPKI